MDVLSVLTTLCSLQFDEMRKSAIWVHTERKSSPDICVLFVSNIRPPLPISNANPHPQNHCAHHLQDLLWIMHCAKEAKGLKKRPAPRLFNSGLGNIGGRHKTPALSTRDVPSTSHGRMSRRTGRSSTFYLHACYI